MQAQSISSLLGPRNNEVKHPRNPRKKTQNETDRIADHLVQKLQSPEHRPLFLRVAWRLDEGTINRYLAAAVELGNNPRAYFITLVKRDKAYRD